MPFASESQRKYMFAKYPDIAKKWAHEGKSKKKRKRNSGNYSMDAVHYAMTGK